MRYRVLGDAVLIDPEPDPEYTELMQFTHVVAPEVFKTGPADPPKWGKVLACGPDCHGIVTRGDRVLYGKFSWAKLQVDATHHYAIVREADLLAVDDACTRTSR